MKWRKVAIFGIVFVSALWLWPSLVHEQLHLVALKLQGASGEIHYDFGFPAHPSITRGEIKSIAGGLLFVLLPSVVSVVILGMSNIVLPRVKWADWEVAVHGLLVYLAFDLIENVSGFRESTSDFHFLTVVGGIWVVVLCEAILIIWTMWIIWVSRDVWW